MPFLNFQQPRNWPNGTSLSLREIGQVQCHSGVLLIALSNACCEKTDSSSNGGFVMDYTVLAEKDELSWISMLEGTWSRSFHGTKVRFNLGHSFVCRKYPELAKLGRGPIPWGFPEGPQA